MAVQNWALPYDNTYGVVVNAAHFCQLYSTAKDI